MSGDHSRISFDHWRDFCARWMQQGRVQLDSDQNDWVAIVERHFRAAALDTFGQAVVPRETPDGFRIEAVGGSLRIHRGRIYVDGILAENHGTGAATWDPHLAEEYRPDPVDYMKQPYYPGVPQLPGGGPYLVYLDVWQREITPQHMPELVEKAIGVDTCTASQVAWQVKLLQVDGTVTCDTPLENIPGWEMNAPSGGRLTTSKQNKPPGVNPCIAPPTAGYTGTEDQNYRIEIHDAGANPTFKWSRDNASVAARVTGIANNTKLTVDSVGKDSMLRFADGDWVEVTDNWRELAGLPGEIRRIKLGGGVDDVGNIIVLDSPLSVGQFPVDGANNTQYDRATRITRWDQKGKVLKEDGTLWHDLDDPMSKGVIPVPPAGTKLLIEQGVLAEITVVAGAQFRPLDYWTFVARTADATVEELVAAPPRGVHHHYAKLGFVTFPDNEHDCRTLWPPETGEGDCECTVCVSVEGHRNGTATIQKAIETVRERGGTVCLQPGIYPLREPLEMRGCHGVTIRGKGIATILASSAPGPVIRIEGARGCRVESLTIAGAPEGDDSSLVQVRTALGLDLHRLYLLGVPRDLLGRCIGVGGVLLGLRITSCMMFADEGIGASRALADFTLAADLIIEDNAWIARKRGVNFDRMSVFASQMRVRGNTSLLCREGAITVTGASLPAANVRIEDNTIHAAGDGIVVGVDDVSVVGNSINTLEQQKAGNGVMVVRGLKPAGVQRLHVLSNRILGMRGHGFISLTPLLSGMIKQNFIERTQLGGISIDAGGGDALSIENNQLLDIAPEEDFDAGDYAAVRIVRMSRVAVRNNVIARVGRNKVRARSVSGVATLSVNTISVTGNELSGIGISSDFTGVRDGIVLHGSPLQAEVSGNDVRRRDQPGDKPGKGRWCGVRVTRDDHETKINALTKFHLEAVGDGWMVYFFGDRVLMNDPVYQRDAIVRGNRIVGDGALSAQLWVAQVGTGIVSENQVSVPDHGLIREALVILEEGTFAFQSNVVRARAGALTVGINPAGRNDARPVTILGNITTSPIEVEGGMPQPMSMLNVVVPALE